jgi:hypothetical protein
VIFAKLNADGTLTDIRNGPQQPNGAWPDGSQDVPLVAMPSGTPGTRYTYDPAKQLAVAQPPTLDQLVAAIPVNAAALQALCAVVDALRQQQTPPAWAVTIVWSVASAANGVQAGAKPG